MRRGWAWLGLLALVLLGCSGKPEEIAYGRDICTFCKMAITDPRFAAEIITKKGKVYKFDSIECMIAATLDGTVDPAEVRHYWVKDFETREWVDAEQARFLQSPRMRSPMGVNLVAFATREHMEAFKMKYDGLELSFEDLPNVVRQSGLVERLRKMSGHMPMHSAPAVPGEP